MANFSWVVECMIGSINMDMEQLPEESLLKLTLYFEGIGNQKPQSVILDRDAASMWVNRLMTTSGTKIYTDGNDLVVIYEKPLRIIYPFEVSPSFGKVVLNEKQMSDLVTGLFSFFGDELDTDSYKETNPRPRTIKSHTPLLLRSFFLTTVIYIAVISTIACGLYQPDSNQMIIWTVFGNTNVLLLLVFGYVLMFFLTWGVLEELRDGNQ